jgi:hypothetical protein
LCQPAETRQARLVWPNSIGKAGPANLHRLGWPSQVLGPSPAKQALLIWFRKGCPAKGPSHRRPQADSDRPNVYEMCQRSKRPCPTGLWLRAAVVQPSIVVLLFVFSCFGVFWLVLGLFVCARSRTAPFCCSHSGPACSSLSVTVSFVLARLCSFVPVCVRVPSALYLLWPSYVFFVFLRSRPFQLDGRPLIFMSSTLLVSGWLWWFFCRARRVAARRALLTWVVAAARLQAMWPEAVGQK